MLVHDPIEPLDLCIEVEIHFRNPYGMDIPAFPGQPHPWQEIPPVQSLAVGFCRCAGKPSTVAAHDFMNDQVPRTGRVLIRNILKEDRALVRRSPGAQRLLDRKDIVVYCLWKAHNR